MSKSMVIVMRSKRGKNILTDKQIDDIKINLDKGEKTKMSEEIHGH